MLRTNILSEPLTPSLKSVVVKIFLTLLIWFAWIGGLSAQEPLKHKKVIYKGSDGKLFINKSLPLYLSISTSPEEGAESWLLESSKTPQYANPMYLDSEGWNTIRSPWAVDTATHEVKYPHQDIIFDVYADGLPPKSKMVFGEVRMFKKEGMLFLNEGGQVSFEGKDEMSGLADFFYSVDGSAYRSLKENPAHFAEEGKYEVLFYSVDHVGNAEKPKKMAFVVDQSAPQTRHTINGIEKNRVLAPDASVVLESQDSLSGIKNIYYAINNGDYKVYQKPIPVSVLSDDESSITYYAEDHVGNKEEPKVIGTIASARGSKAEDETVFDYYIDREAPEVSLSFEGDHYKGDQDYISGNTRVVLSAKDDKSGVKSILFSYNSFVTSEEYAEPFLPEGNSLVKMSYSATDWVDNAAKEKIKTFYIDRDAPESKVVFRGPVFRNRDTLFIARATRAEIQANDKESGLKRVFYNLNGAEGEYVDPFGGWKAGLNHLEWRSEDRVNNREESRQMVFVMDDEPPVIYYHFSVEPIGKKVVRGEEYVIYPSNTKLYIGATDNTTGEETLRYRINGKETSGVLPIEGFKPDNYEIVIEAADALKNKASKTIRFAIEK
ncbi:OmpL47-type beta-barrel domain-containing protein [Thermophagus sp. OGC60D27]|uniref:OmpL47-type beta-barrel domain-containing protein n=1 Tax=Thermophagus sp. OGC60D27 TaxID=3458415 RepID=UPI0040382A14